MFFFRLFVFYVIASGQTCNTAPRGIVHVEVLYSSFVKYSFFSDVLQISILNV